MFSIGHSKGYAFARRENIPLVRIGFPIHDRMGGQRILHLGYDARSSSTPLPTQSLPRSRTIRVWATAICESSPVR